MKRWTPTWAALLVAGFMTMPATGFAQTAASPTPSTAVTQDKSEPARTAEQGAPQEHLQKADAAINSIAPGAVTGKAKSQIAELKKHINALEKFAQGNSAAPTSANASQWASDAAAADKILGELLADAPSSGAASATASEAKPVGTAGVTPSKATAAVTLDDASRAKLMEARASLMAFAAAMNGAAPAAAAEPAAPSASTAAAPANSAAPAEPSSPAAPTTPPTAAPASRAQPAAEPASPPQAPASTSPEQAPTGGATAQSPAPAKPAVNADAAKAALTAARDSLSQMTQLPAAQQLTGEHRTQVSQLIANFNELITTNTEWRASYAKLDANLTALLGAQTTDESPAAPATGTAGAVGTSGTTTGALDPGVKAKLVEFRTHLKEFEQAAGGAIPK